MDHEKRPLNKGLMTMLAFTGISVATLAGLWVLSLFCLEHPSTKPLAMADWNCGAWSGYLAVATLVAGVAGISVAWRAINRKL